MQVCLQAQGVFQLVDIEGRVDAGDTRRTPHAAAGRQHQAVVVQLRRRALGIAVLHPLAGHVDALRAALHETHADRGEQFAQRRRHALHVRLVETRADAQLGLRREHRDLDVVAALAVELAHCAQRAPHAGESGTDDQDTLFHWGLLEGKEGMSGERPLRNYDYICRSYGDQSPKSAPTGNRPSP